MYIVTLRKWIYNVKSFLLKYGNKTLHPISPLFLVKVKKEKKNIERKTTRTKSFQKGSNYKWKYLDQVSFLLQIKKSDKQNNREKKRDCRDARGTLRNQSNI